MIYAFLDASDGYYQVDIADGAPLPAWTQLLTPTAVRPALPPVPPTPAEQIEALERQYMLPRPVRDVLLPLMEAKAAELGYTTEQLRAANPGYRKVKELDEQIAALRELL